MQQGIAYINALIMFINEVFVEVILQLNHTTDFGKAFSIIVPVYNVEEYIKECFDSIINQTFSDFEVICINDGSTDGSLSILEEYAASDNRFKIISQQNQGQGIARNKALEIARGEYIVFVDPDDWIETNTLEELYKFFQQTNAEVIEFNYRKYNDYSGEFQNKSHRAFMMSKFKYDLLAKSYYTLREVKKGCFSSLTAAVWTRAYSKKFLDRINAEFAPTKHGEDHFFTQVVVLNASKIFYLDKYLYNYRCRRGSAVNSISNYNFGVFKNIEYLKNYLIKNDFYNELEEEFRSYLVRIMAYHYKYIPSNSIDKYLSKCQEYLTPKEYKKMLKRVTNRYNSIFELIFSLKNDDQLGIKRKIITIFGIKIKLKPKQKKVEV